MPDSGGITRGCAASSMTAPSRTRCSGWNRRTRQDYATCIHCPSCSPPRRNGRRYAMADKQLASTAAAAAFQKQWFADLRRKVFEERQPYALVQADVPFELFDLLGIPAISNQWWSALVAAKRQAPAFLDAMRADGL